MVHQSYSVDHDGDVIIRDADTSHVQTEDAEYLARSPDPEAILGLDGHTSQGATKFLPKALHIEQDAWVELLDLRGCTAWYTAEGDVVLDEETLCLPTIPITRFKEMEERLARIEKGTCWLA
jgi:hypothetical protein